MDDPTVRALLGTERRQKYRTNDRGEVMRFPGGAPIPDLSDVPTFGRQGFTAGLGELAKEEAPGMAAMALGPVARALVAAPRVTGAAAGALGLTAANSTAGVSSEGPLQQLYAQRAALAQRRDAAVAKRDAEARTGKGPNYDAANAEASKLDAELSGIDGMIADEQKRSSPEYAMEMQKKADELVAEQKEREASTPFRERYPKIAGALPGVGIALAGGAPFLLRGKANLGTFMPGSYPSRMHSAIREAEGAIASGSKGAMDVSRRELDNLIAAQPTTMDGVTKALVTGGSGGLLAAEAGMFPAQYDAFNLPEGPAQDAAHEEATSVMPYVKRGVVGALTGMSGYKLGDIIPSRTANLPRGQALADHLRDNPAVTVPQIVTKSSFGTFHGPDGRFISPPKR